MKTINELQEKLGVTPAGVLAAMERIGITPTGRTCGREYAEVVEFRNPDTGIVSLQPGERKVCGAMIFESKSKNRDFSCGACDIREDDCVRETAQVFWAKKGGNPRRIERAMERANARIVYSGFESRTKTIFSSAEKLYNHELKKLLEAKREAEAAERQEVLKLAKRRADVNRAAMAMKRGEDLG